MGKRDLEPSWERTTAHLEAARRLLRPEADGLRDFADYLAHNELGLAFEVLAQIGEAENARSTFWDALAAAAAEMNLSDTDPNHGASVRLVNVWMAKEDLYPCPCCGYLVFEEGPGSYDICPVCGWEDDLVQLRFPEMGGANRPLVICQVAYANPREWERSSVSPEEHGFTRDPLWRPLDPEVDNLERPVSQADYGDTYPDDPTVYYYWRRRRV